MKVFFCETFDDGTVGGSHACMYNLIYHMDRSKIHFTAGFYSDNIYVPRYRQIGVDVEILPFPKPAKQGNLVLRKAINWYNLDYKAREYLEGFFQERNFDLVVLNNSIYASLLFVRVCKRLKIPVIVYERGIGYFEKKHIEATEDIQVSIPISDAVHRFILSYHFRTKVIERIYDGIDPDSLTPQRSPAEIKKALSIPTNSRIVGIIGNIRPWKGQQYFIESFLQLASKYDDLWGLVIGGWGDEDREYQLHLKKMVERAGLQDRLVFLGYRTDIPNLLSVFDVFVHASIKPEPFGMVILEAMAAKKPVVATNIGAPVEILNKGECGALVPPKDGRAIAEACSKYLDDPVFTQRVVATAYKQVIQNFHICQTVTKTAKLFEKVCQIKWRN